MSKPQTAVLETRIDICRIAELAVFYNSKNVALRTKSELIRVALEDYCSLLERNAGLVRFSTSGEAIAELSELGYDPKNKGGRNRQTLLRDLSESMDQESSTSPLDEDVRRALEEIESD